MRRRRDRELAQNYTLGPHVHAFIRRQATHEQRLARAREGFAAMTPEQLYAPRRNVMDDAVNAAGGLHG